MNPKQKQLAPLAILAGIPWALANTACGVGPGETTDAKTDAPTSVEAGALDGGITDPGQVPLPSLRPISSKEAIELGRYVRSVKTQDTGRSAVSVAWSMVNRACNERAELVNWAIATSPENLAEAVAPTMSPADVTQEKIDAIVASPTRDAAMIQVAGPLIAEQTLIDPDGRDVAGEPQTVLWTYHFAAIVNVEGTMKVMDLSVGDTPMDIDAWIHSFVSPQQSCLPMDDVAFHAVWAYWLAVANNWDLAPRPALPCGYQIYPLLRVRRDQAPASLEGLPGVLEDQNIAFRIGLSTKGGLGATQEQIPAFLSRYKAKTESDFCRSWQSKRCN